MRDTGKIVTAFLLAVALSALLTMINSCANGIATVNIDNGYGAGYLATQINRLALGTKED